MTKVAPFRVACADPAKLAERITWMPLMVVSDLATLRAGDYQDEGVMVPDVDRRRALTAGELGAIAVPLDTPGAMRLVRVPKTIEALAAALRRNGPVHASSLGTVILSGITDMQLSIARPGKVNTTINTAIDRYVGVHIDAKSRPDPAEPFDVPMMGVAASETGRAFSIAPSVNMDCIPPHLAVVSDADQAQRLERRAAIRAHVQRRIEQGEEVGCYMLALEGSLPESDTHEAYANAYPRFYAHDGSTIDNESGESTAMLFFTPSVVGPNTFPSIV